MPITKRRKTEQGEGNSGEKEGHRVAADNKDAVTDKQSKGDNKNDTSAQSSERKHRQTGRQDSTQQTPETPKIPHIGAVTRSRVVKKPKRDLSPPPSPTKKPVKETKTNTPETKQKRQWELWSIDDKDAFFEGLFETGKDFESIQNFIAQKCRKKGFNPSLVKNKDQVRHFYYRTWHKISKYIQPTPDVKKETQELYGLINYGVLRKRIKGLNDKTGAKLNDLVHNGFTTVKIRGKNLRIKTPVCLALKKLNNIDTTEHKCDPVNRIPDKIQVEMNPKTNTAWNLIQEMSFNPRLKLMLKPNRTLSSVITYLSQKWKSHRLKLKETISGTETETGPILTIYPHPDSDITPMTLQATKEPKINITFSDYRENLNIFNSPSGCREKKGESTKTTSTIHSENSHSVDFTDPKNGMFESPKCRASLKDSKGGTTPTSSSVYGVDAAFLSEGENAMFPDTPLSKNDSKSTENLTETDSTNGSPQRHGSGDVPELEIIKNNSSDNDDKCLESEDKESLNIKEALEKGWTATSAENLTIAQLYLMLGKDGKIRLEYDFCKAITIEDIVKTQLTNTLRRLVHLAVMEITDVKVPGSASSPCHTCGAVRAKATRGCGVKGQKAGSKNPLSSRLGTTEGLVDASTQTTFKNIEPINSSQSKEAVFRVPVARDSFLQKSTVPSAVPNQRPLNQAFGVHLPGYRNGRRVRQVNRKPMVVQRTILPKANIFTLVQPNGQSIKSVINVPNSISCLSTLNSAMPGSVVNAVHLDVQSRSQTAYTLNPSQLQSHQRTIIPSHMPGPLQTITLGPGQLPVTVTPAELSGSVELPTASTVNVFTTSVATNHTDMVTTTASTQGSLSPPSISNLLDMSFSNFGTPSGDGEKLFDMALGTGASFGPLLDDGTNKIPETSTPKTDSFKRDNITRSPPCTSAWMNGEVCEMSFISLLNESSKPIDTIVPMTSLQPQALFFENSRDSSIMGKFDVDTLMNESSMDFVAKFADLQALTQEDSMAEIPNLNKKTISNG